MAENTNIVVIDCSAVMAFILPDEKNTPAAKEISKVLKTKNILVSPTLLEFEVGNALKSGILSKRITQFEARFLLETFRQLNIKPLPINRDSVLRLSLKHGLSFYDASYLYLAKANKCKLLTLDKILSDCAN